jgi:hypothetical protein
MFININAVLHKHQSWEKIVTIQSFDTVVIDRFRK